MVQEVMKDVDIHYANVGEKLKFSNYNSSLFFDSFFMESNILNYTNLYQHPVKEPQFLTCIHFLKI